MNLEKLSFGASLTVTFLAVAGLAACERHSDVPPSPMGASPSAQVIGTIPAAPTGDPPGTTPVAAATTEVSKPVEQTAMPLPGQPNDHSNLAAAPSQKAESIEVLKSPAAAKKANSGPPADERK